MWRFWIVKDNLPQTLSTSETNAQYGQPEWGATALTGEIRAEHSYGVLAINASWMLLCKVDWTHADLC